ncbi:serine/threonine protein kinase [Fusarium austroafricanum]|uniref:Serine/threonine protein kinase n=1 Tax=Fusarium austroafricanum TaxID=2364996 RepID=A0A8H4JVZ7_9HYPO|nr:serine/threonine protein kinase [Fusarium austroafricanum]
MATINDSYVQCSSSFSRLVEILKNPPRDNTHQVPVRGVANEHARFNVWAGSVGAKHSPHKRISLDYRLRDSNFYTVRVVDMLQRLDNTLNTTNELISGERPLSENVKPKFDRQQNTGSDRSSIASSTESSSSDEADMLTLERQMSALYESIQNSVRHLYSLAMVIRQPVAIDRLSRASKIPVDHFVSFDQRHIEECFPDASPVLKERLADSITRRRQLLMYNEQHYRKSSEPQPSEEPKVMDHSAQEGIQRKAREQSPQNASVNPGRIEDPVEDLSYHPPSIAHPSILASTEATKFVPPVDMKEEPDTQSENGTISTFGFTGADGENLRIPPRPEGDNAEPLEQFLCPLCYHLIEVRNTRAWTRHVFRDLQAYVCTFDNCQAPGVLFETRQDWIRHEIENHRREWHCNDPKHNVCRTESEFVAHMKAFHELQLSEPQLLSLAKMCERSSSADNAVCPLCRDGYHDVENGFECFKPSSIVRRASNCNLPGSLENEELDIAKLPEGNFNETNDNILRKVAPWVISLPSDCATDNNSTPDTSDEPQRTHLIISQREPFFVPSGDLKRHIGQHLERLALFAINRSKLILDDGKSAQTEEAMARSESSFVSFQSLDSLDSNEDCGKEERNFLTSALDDSSLETKEGIKSDDSEMIDDKAKAAAIAELEEILDEIRDEMGSIEDRRNEIPRKEAQKIHQLIGDTLVNDEFDGRPNLFLPEGSLGNIITAKSVIRTFCNPYDNPGPTEIESLASQLRYTLVRGQKVFATLVLSGFAGKLLQQAIHLFSDNGICDKKLPLEKSDLRSLSESPPDPSHQAYSDSGSYYSAWPEKFIAFGDKESIDDFWAFQWRLCAPIFSMTPVANILTFHQYLVLPFTKRIHERHLEVKDSDSHRPEYVAVKRLQRSLPENEASALQQLRMLDQRHILNLIASFRWRDDDERYLMFEWTDGGTLRDLWNTFPRLLTVSLVKSVVEQIHGFAHALKEAHYAIPGTPLAHGDLKPERILHFKDVSGAGGIVGTLKISDWNLSIDRPGLRKFRLRDSNKYRSLQYVSPEGAMLSSNNPAGITWFQHCDVWAMGCIILEFLVWLMYGPAELDKFNESIKPKLSLLGPERRTFWESDLFQNTTVHPVAVRWMEHMAKDPACKKGQTALGNLLGLVQDRLLVVDIASKSESTLVPRPVESSSGDGTAVSIDSTHMLEESSFDPVITLAEPFAAFESNQGQEQPCKRARASAREFSEYMDLILHASTREEYWLPITPLQPPNISSGSLHPVSPQRITPKELEDLGANAKKYRQKIEALRSSVGNKPLSALGEESWSGIRSPVNSQPKISPGENERQFPGESTMTEINNSAARIGLDFPLVKFEAPQEFQPLGHILTTEKRWGAEDGLLHTTARKLGALFGSLLDQTPNLFKAYGMRCSQIVSNKDATQLSTMKVHGQSLRQERVDCGSIWAAATSGASAVAMHLLACMIARIWAAEKAVSIWTMMVDERLRELEKYESLGALEGLAVGEEIAGHQLAQWDASARSWLGYAEQTDEIKEKHTQLQLILKNVLVAMPINSSTGFYEDMIQAWKSAMTLAENLIIGQPQEVRDFAILHSLSTWHLFPDVILPGDPATEIKQNDPLIAPGGILTVGTTRPIRLSYL